MIWGSLSLACNFHRLECSPHVRYLKIKNKNPSVMMTKVKHDFVSKWRKFCSGRSATTAQIIENLVFCLHIKNVNLTFTLHFQISLTVLHFPCPMNTVQSRFSGSQCLHCPRWPYARNVVKHLLLLAAKCNAVLHVCTGQRTSYLLHLTLMEYFWVGN